MLFINIRIQWSGFFYSPPWKTLDVLLLVNSTRKKTCVCVWSAVTHSSGHFLTAASCRRKVTPFVFCPTPHPDLTPPRQGPESSLGAQETAAHSSSCLLTWMKSKVLTHCTSWFLYPSSLLHILFFGGTSNKDQIEPMMLPLFLSSAL